MPREVTVKDVLYGLEYMHGQLVRKSGGRGASWWLIPGPLKVGPHVADEVRRDPHVHEFAATPNETRYGWKDAA